MDALVMEDKVRGNILVLRGAKREAQDCGLAAFGVEDTMWDKILTPQRGEKGSAGLRLGRFRRGGQDMGRLGRFLRGRQDVGQEFGSPEG